jgi:sugar lactone lactonase YvrE
MSLGLKINKSGRLFVAGGFSRELRVIDSISGRVLTAYTVGAQGTLVNDVVLTPKAAWFTDSYSAQLYAIPLGSNGELPSQGEVITRRLTGEWVQGPNHAANGIERTPDGCGLLMVNTHVGSLFRISPRTGYARQVVYDGPSLINGDGMLLQGRILYIVQKNVIDILRLDGSGSSAIHVGQITDPRFQIPTAVAAFRDRLYLPNARFDVEPTPTTTYNAIAVPRYS